MVGLVNSAAWASAYSEKLSTYLRAARRPFMDGLPDAPEGRQLEIGCGEGLTSAYALEAGKCGFALGIELCEAPSAKAGTRLDRVLVGDVDLLLQDGHVNDLLAREGPYDAVITSELLEHLRDPWTMLRKLTPLVSSSATVVASSPNVAHHSVIRVLLAGRWDLAESGTIDRTHLRWFTPTSFAAMFEDARYEVLSSGPADDFRRKARVINRLTGGRFQHLLHPQIVLTARRRT